MKNQIEHLGVVEDVDGCRVKVKIVQSSACSSCHARSMCNSSESKEKIVDVTAEEYESYEVGVKVVVCVSMSMGRKAVMLAFAYPMALMLAWIIVCSSVMHVAEIVSIAGALVLLAVYYFILYLRRDRIDRSFFFSLRHY